MSSALRDHFPLAEEIKINLELNQLFEVELSL
jgi:hypothetical protein